MAITSPTKRSDQEVYVICAEMLEIAVRLYKKTGKPELAERIKEQVAFLEKLQEKIHTHDYTEDDYWYWRINKAMNSYSHPNA